MKLHVQQTTFPIYDAGGVARGTRSLKRFRELVAQGHLAPVRNKKGYIVGGMHQSRGGSSPILPTAHMGTAYSFRPRAASSGELVTHRAYELKRLGGRNRDGQTPDRYLYCTSVLDVLSPADRAEMEARLLNENQSRDAKQQAERVQPSIPAFGTVVPRELRS